MLHSVKSGEARQVRRFDLLRALATSPAMASGLGDSMRSLDAAEFVEEAMLHAIGVVVTQSTALFVALARSGRSGTQAAPSRGQVATHAACQVKRLLMILPVRVPRGRSRRLGRAYSQKPSGMGSVARPRRGTSCAVGGSRGATG